MFLPTLLIVQQCYIARWKALLYALPLCCKLLTGYCIPSAVSHTYIKLKLTELAIQLYQILKLNELSNFSLLLNASIQITFSKLQVTGNYVFHEVNLLLSLQTQCTKKRCLCFAILSYSEKLWNVFEIVSEECELFVQKSLSWKKYFRRNFFQTLFVV